MAEANRNVSSSLLLARSRRGSYRANVRGWLIRDEGRGLSERQAPDGRPALSYVKRSMRGNESCDKIATSGRELRADCGGVLARPPGTGPRSRAASRSTGGAAMATGPFGVSTVCRRSAGWWENAATSLTNPRRCWRRAVSRPPDRATGWRSIAPICASTTARLATRTTSFRNLVVCGSSGSLEELRAKLDPFAFVLDRYQHQRVVVGCECAIRADRGMREAQSLRRLAGAFVIQQRNVHPVGHAVEQADFQRVALSGDAAADQRLQHAGMRRHAARDVARRDADAARPGGLAGDHGEPGFRLHQQVVRLHRRVVAGFAVTGNIDGDQARVSLAQFRRIRTRRAPRRRVPGSG